MARLWAMRPKTKSKQATSEALITLPPGLVEAVKNKRVVLFLGAGASMEARGPGGMKPPSSKDLRAALGKKFLGDSFEDYDLMTVADLAIRSAGQPVVFEAIKTLLDPFQPSPAHLMIPRFRWRAIATTNYDLLVEKAYAKANHSVQDVVPLVKNVEPVEERMQSVPSPVLLLKLHGCVNHLHDAAIPLVLSHEHYAFHSRHRDALFSRLETWAHESTFLFCGYSLGDAHVRNILHRLESEGIRRPTYYIVSPTVPEQVAGYWAALNVTVLPTSFGTLMSSLDTVVPEMWRHLDPGVGRAELSVQTHFRTHADPSPTLVAVLDRDLQHVHASMPFDPQDARRFYEGYDTGWGAIALNFDVRRRVVEDLLLEAIADDAGPPCRFFLLRGPAGSGKTVSLKRAAWTAATDLEQLVLWLEESGSLRVDALAELYELTGKRALVFVDRALERLPQIERLLSAAHHRSLPLSVIAGERDNEWNVYGGRISDRWAPRELRIGRLTTPEIGRLVDLLAQHNSLGLLQDASRQERIEAFEKRAERQLLVALHEVTRGKPFEEIVYDEYMNIVPERAQQLYLDVCTLNQFGAPVRAGTISRASGIRFNDFEAEFFAPLEGVVLTEQDRTTMDVSYRARHAKVAEMVFRQACATDEARVEQLIRLAGHLDIGYSPDRHALDRLSRGRSLKDLVSAADFGRQIYRALLRMAPDQDFLYQQWAIFEMQIADGSFEEAERLARTASELDPGSRSFAHTRVEVARRRALNEESPVLREQFRRQAKQRLADAGPSTDRLVLSSKCKLFVDEVAELVEGMAEANDDTMVDALAEKIKQTESTLRQAQQLYSDDPDLLETEARLGKTLNQRDRAIKALERAWRSQPRSQGLGTRLSKAYVEKGDLVRARGILEEAITRSPDDRGAHLELAKLLLRMSEDSPTRAGQHLARSYFRGDKNFDARHLHAQYLFMVGQANEARALFAEVARDAPPEFRTISRHHDSPISARLGHYSGRVGRKDATYLFIRCAAYPDEIYGNEQDSAEEHWRALASGADVDFRIRFGRKGPVACDVRTKTTRS